MRLFGAALAAVLALAGACVISSPTPRATAKTVIIFGDSQSDNCNVWRRQNSASSTYPWPACPPSPTGRAMAAPVWGEWVKTNNPSWTVQFFAQRGADADNNHFTPVSSAPDLAGQVSRYFTQYGTRSKSSKILTSASTTWFVVQLAGGNDIESAITDGRGTVAQDISAVKTNLQTLINASAKYIILFNMYNYDTNPHWRSSTNKTLVQTYEANYNSQLTSLVSSLNSQGKATIKIFDFKTLVTSIQTTPSSYGITNTQDECESLSSCTGYLWYDDRHFAHDIQPIIATNVASALS